MLSRFTIYDPAHSASLTMFKVAVFGKHEFLAPRPHNNLSRITNLIALFSESIAVRVTGEESVTLTTYRFISYPEDVLFQEA